jgi:hypothetical protein
VTPFRHSMASLSTKTRLAAGISWARLALLELVLGIRVCHAFPFSYPTLCKMSGISVSPFRVVDRETDLMPDMGATGVTSLAGFRWTR